MRVTVIGCGYLGATHAACMAELGHDVLGVDIDPAKIGVLSAGRAPFHEPGLDELITRNVATGRLRFGTSFAEAARFGEVHFLAVGTPQLADDGRADLRQLRAATMAMAPHLERPCVVIGKSTVPTGTAEALAAELARSAPAGDRVRVAWNPEFLREGHGVADTLRPDRLVFGVAEDDETAMAALRAVYRPLLGDGVPVVETDLVTAELIKVAANSFLATKISFINAMAEVCEAADGNVRHLAEALGHDARIGPGFLRPGVGFGGGCLPKDIRAFTARAEELGAGQAVRFLREVDAVNERRRARVVELARQACGGSVAGRRIGVWGAAFKPGTDDVRDSPALAVASALRADGADVTVYDPSAMAMANARRAHPELDYATSALGVAADADVVLHLTEWPEFTEIDPADLAGRVRRTHLVDGRCVLDGDRWRAAGWTYHALGTPEPIPLSA